MSKFEIHYSRGATPLDPDEKAGLLPDYITTQGELNLLERENNPIFSRFRLPTSCTNGCWAGSGSGPEKPDSQTKALAFSGTKASTYPWDEVAARFHHRLVSIHVFPKY